MRIIARTKPLCQMLYECITLPHILNFTLTL